MKTAFFLTATALFSASCGVAPKTLQDFCTEQYAKVTLNGMPIGEPLIASCLDKMRVCTSQELGIETHTRSRGYLPPCHDLEEGACNSACAIFSRKSFADLAQGR